MTMTRWSIIDWRDAMTRQDMTSRIRIAIVIEEAALHRTSDVIDACRALGFEADAALTGVGIFTGSIEPHLLESLRSIVGVAAVELERQTQIHAA